MEFKTTYISPDIKLTEYFGKPFKAEVVFEYHILVWFLSGETKILLGDASHVFQSGDIFLIPRHQVATVINYPKDGLPHKCVAMHLTELKLKDYYSRFSATAKKQPLQSIRNYREHPLLESCLNSIMPYFKLQGDLPATIADIKIDEAISILRTLDNEIDGLLTNFEQPGKIPLADFMERHYMFNLKLERFGFLTGRSLATFRRDFKKIYQTKPQKWLTEKRLKLAHYQIVEKQIKPNDVYFEAGFENLSHFSYAFKKHFGYSPNTLLLK